MVLVTSHYACLFLFRLIVRISDPSSSRSMFYCGNVRAVGSCLPSTSSSSSEPSSPLSKSRSRREEKRREEKRIEEKRREEKRREEKRREEKRRKEKSREEKRREKRRRESSPLFFSLPSLSSPALFS